MGAIRLLGLALVFVLSLAYLALAWQRNGSISNDPTTSTARHASSLNLDRLEMKPITYKASNSSGKEPERYSGYFKLDRATYDAQMFFFYFQARDAEPDTPVVLWMTGGPGCSSELAVFFENGPWQIIDEDGKLTIKETEYGWDVNAHMIFVDQPINTGFSYSDDDRDRCFDEDCVGKDMLDFLEHFFTARPELAGKAFYVTGESYAGHYVPAVASVVYQASVSGDIKADINLKGLAIGNGLTDPAIQYGLYGEYAYQNKLISENVRDGMSVIFPACRIALEACDGVNWRVECLLAVEFCQATQFAPVLAFNPTINVYDIRKECEGALCYSEFEILDDFLNDPDVQKSFGVDREWVSCSMSVHSDMMGDWGHRFDTVLPELLANGVDVLIYAGDKDLICNYVGNRAWVDKLPWEGADDWAAAKEETWTVDGEAAGSVTSAAGLSFLRVFDAGHMVPMDQPKRALDMITRFSRNKPLATSDGGGDEEKEEKVEMAFSQARKDLTRLTVS